MWLCGPLVAGHSRHGGHAVRPPVLCDSAYHPMVSGFRFRSGDPAPEAVNLHRQRALPALRTKIAARRTRPLRVSEHANTEALSAFEHSRRKPHISSPLSTFRATTGRAAPWHCSCFLLMSRLMFRCHSRQRRRPRRRMAFDSSVETKCLSADRIGPFDGRPK